MPNSLLMTQFYQYDTDIENDRVVHMLTNREMKRL